MSEEIKRFDWNEVDWHYIGGRVHIKALAAPEAPRQDVQQMASMPVERCYDVRTKMIIAFNESRKNGGDLDDGLDAAYKAALRYSPAPLSPDHSGGGAGVVAISAAEAFGKGFNLLEQTDGKYRITMAFQNSDDAFGAYRQLAELRKCLDKVKELNQ